ncbi:MAG: serine/threonine protein kinase [Nodosilinea sp. LVE1205-7]|jgi:serine/threonine-protein kinase
MVDLNVSSKVANRYQLLELVGQGAMGRVYLAEDLMLGHVKVAIKFLTQTLITEKTSGRFENEAITSALLGQKSIHVVRVTEHGVNEDKIPFYVMEYLRGQSLSQLIQAQPLPTPRFLGLTVQICLGLQAAHEGINVKGQSQMVPIIHRDIKPSNIMIIQDPTLGEMAKILDFGIAKLMQMGSQQTDCFMGTLAYASPEQMDGCELDCRSDIYSLGVMMFEMLTGHLPLRPSAHNFGSWYKAHHQESPRLMAEVASHLKIPRPLEEVVMSCIAKRPEDRPQTVREIMQRLEPLESRYGAGFRMGQRINTALNRVPVVGRPEAKKIIEDDHFCKLTIWPQTKPVAEIVFSQTLSGSRGNLAALWAMMPEEDIARRLISTRYNTFICTMEPHPVVLWLTVLYNSAHGARWLPCYLDLKTSLGQDMVSLLATTGSYKILLFALENPHQCQEVLTCSIAQPQRSMLQEWIITARTRPSLGTMTTSRNLLRNEFKTNLKTKVIKKLESVYLDSGSTFSE